MENKKVTDQIDMNQNTKIEVAREIMNFMVARCVGEGLDYNSERFQQVLADERAMIDFDEAAIDKIINVYGPLVRSKKKMNFKVDMETKDVDLDKIKEKYYLTDAQVKQAKEAIITNLTGNRKPSEKPLVIVVGGQSGSGKTSLINYTEKMSAEHNFVQIDNDFFRGFHPRVEEIVDDCPDYYVTATDQLGVGITSEVIDYFRNHKYNIILHQTLKNNRVVDDAITKFIDAGYTVGVRAFAVPYFESKMSQIERCEGQLASLGYCRHVSKEAHNTAIAGLPQVVDYIESNGKFDFIEIFKRTENAAKPGLVYAKFNEATKDKTLDVLSDYTHVSKGDQTFGFANAREAVEKTRETEAIQCAKTLDERIAKAEQSEFNNPVMQLHIDELKNELYKFKTTKKKSTLAIQTGQALLCDNALRVKICGRESE